MPELGPYGSVRGARGNSRPYRESGRPTVKTALLTHVRHWMLIQESGCAGHDGILIRSVISLRRTAIDGLLRNNSFLVSDPRRLSMPMPDWNSSHRRDAMPVGFTRSDGRAVNRR
jgi:hypothetical protein